MYKPRLVLHYV